MLPAAVVTRRARNGRCVVGMKSDPMFRTGDAGFNRRHWRGGDWVARPIKRKSERFAERGECTLGGVGFSRLEGRVVNLTGRGAATFTRSMTFPDDCCAVRVHRYPDTGRVDRKKRSSIFARKYATGLDRFPIPAVESEDPVRFRDRVPSLNVGERPAIRLRVYGRSGGRDCAAAPSPVLPRAHQRVLTLKTGSGLDRATPSISAPPLSSLSSPCRSSRGALGCQ